MGIEDVHINWMKLRFTLSLERYGGKIEAEHRSPGGGGTTTATIDKSMFSIGVFPLNFNLLNRIDLNFGIELAGLIEESNCGTTSWWSGPAQWNYDLTERYPRYSSRMTFGLRGRVAYNFEISEKLVLSPQYSFYYGLTPEFAEFPRQTKSMRNYFSIGVKRKI